MSDARIFFCLNCSIFQLNLTEACKNCLLLKCLHLIQKIRRILFSNFYSLLLLPHFDRILYFYHLFHCIYSTLSVGLFFHFRRFSDAICASIAAYGAFEECESNSLVRNMSIEHKQKYVHCVSESLFISLAQQNIDRSSIHSSAQG